VAHGWHKERLKQKFNQGIRLITLYIRRCQHDQINVIGGYLAYISLLSLVPFIAVMFSVMGAFPMFSEWREQLEAFLYANVVPSKGDELRLYIAGFVENIGKMTAVGIGALVVVALMLIHNIDKTINSIFRIKKRPRLIISFSIYWMVLTFGPILLGASIAVSSYILSLSSLAEDYTPGLQTLLLAFTPYLFSVLAFFLLYLVVPNAKVQYRHAFVGAAVASVLFEFLKKGFALYITQFPSYQAIYGALALVPILFLWIYLVWLVVLLGAELTALLQELDQQDKPEFEAEQETTE
jgi:membrane protein